MRNLFLQFLLLMPVFCLAQDAPPPPGPPPPPPFVVEEMPRFIGCEELELSKKEREICAQAKLDEFINTNLNYPQIANANNLTGTCIVQFILKNDGSIRDVQLIEDIGYGCGSEAVRIVELMAEKIMWIPGKEKGKAVDMCYKLPINFELDKAPSLLDYDNSANEKLDDPVKTIQRHIKAFNAGEPLKNLTTTASGLKIQLLKKGTGPIPTAGQTVDVHYHGALLSDGRYFDSSYKRYTPLSFKIGTGLVIEGWEEGIMQLPEGSTAILYVPSDLAYGEKSAGKIIKPNSDLAFYIELLSVKD